MKAKKSRMLRLALASMMGGLIAGAAVLMTAQSAKAQAAYGSYVGIGAGFGLSSDDSGDGDGVAALIAGRYRFLRIPVSIRAQAFIGDGFAIVPTVSYDYPLSWNTDIYLGAGVSFTGDDPSVLGDQTAFVLQPGIDYMFPNSRFAAFGNAVIAFDAFRDDSGTAVSIQGGVGYQF